MIKARDYEDQAKNSRLDAAMLALGFAWDGGAYIKSKKENVAKVKVASRATVGRKKRIQRPSWTHEFYDHIKALGHGESMDISEQVKSARLDSKKAQMRIFSYLYSKGIHKSHRYMVAGNGTVFAVTRI